MYQYSFCDRQFEKKNYEQHQSFLVKCIEWSRWSGIALILVKISLFCDWSGICNYVEFSRGLLLLLFWWYLYLFSALLFRLTKIHPCKFILITTPLSPSPSSPPPPPPKKVFSCARLVISYRVVYEILDPWSKHKETEKIYKYLPWIGRSIQGILSQGPV